MYDFDYVPLDQAVIDQEVERFMQRRNEAKKLLRDACKNAGGNYDIIVFHEIRKNFKEFKNVVKALEDLKIFWCEVDREILVSRHELYDVIYDKSRA